MLADAGEVGKALERQKKSVALQPERPEFKLGLAKLYLLKGDKMLAKDARVRCRFIPGII